MITTATVFIFSNRLSVKHSSRLLSLKYPNIMQARTTKKQQVKMISCLRIVFFSILRVAKMLRIAVQLSFTLRAVQAQTSSRKIAKLMSNICMQSHVPFSLHSSVTVSRSMTLSHMKTMNSIKRKSSHLLAWPIATFLSLSSFLPRLDSGF